MKNILQEKRQYLSPKKCMKVLTDLKFLEEIKGDFYDNTNFFKDVFFPIWRRYGNQFLKNFRRIWKRVSDLNVDNNCNNEGENVILFRCMSLKEYKMTLEKGKVYSPSWTCYLDVTTLFQSLQILTGYTTQNVIVVGEFRSSDVLYYDDVEGEHFLKYETKFIKMEKLYKWGVEDVENYLRNKLENVKVTHGEIDNGNKSYLDVLKNRGVTLSDWENTNGLWKCKKTSKKVKKGHKRAHDIISNWGYQCV